MIKILNILQQLTLGGAARAMIATAKYSSRSGEYVHSAVSLLPAQQEAVKLAESEGMSVINNPDKYRLNEEVRKADIVHIQFWNSPEMYDLLRIGLPPARILGWYHIAGDKPPQIITHETVDYFDMAVPCSPYTYKHRVFEEMTDDEKAEKSAMVYGATDFERLAGIEKKEHTNFNVGYIGTIDWVKLHPDFVRMSSAIDIPDLKIVVCGTGVERELIQQARELNSEHKFDFRGYVEDIKSVIEILDVYGYPLCEDTYAASELNLQEVMYAGVPPVVFPYGGVKYLVEHEKTGLIIHSEKEYKEAVEYLCHNPNERKRLGENAAKYARQVFGAENAARDMNKAYEKLMKKPKREHFWGKRADISLIEQEIRLSDFYRLPENIPGSEAFMESLAGCAKPFRISKYSDNIEEILPAEKMIIHSPAVLKSPGGGGILHYRNFYQNDPFLRMWTGLSLIDMQRYPEAVGEFSAALNLGLNHWRIAWYISIAAEKAGNLQSSEQAVEAIRKVNPKFQNTIIDIFGSEDQFLSKEKKDEPEIKLSEPSLKLSSIVSTYNSEEYFRGCMEDLTGQTLFEKKQMEIVIIDSGSEQNEGDIAREFLNKYKNIKFERTERESIYAAWNRGIMLAKGEYISNANTDDRHRKDGLELLSKILDENPEYGIIYPDMFITNRDNETFENNSAEKRYDWPDYNIGTGLSNFLFSAQPVWRKNVHLKLGYFDPELKIAGDYDFFMKIAHEFGAAHFRETTGLFHARADSLSGSSNKRSTIDEALAVLKKHRNEIPLEKVYPKLSEFRGDTVAEAAAQWDFANLCMLSPYNDFEKAVELYQKAIKTPGLPKDILDQLVVMFHNNAGIILNCVGNYSQGNDLLNKAAQFPLAKKNFEDIENSRKEGLPLAPVRFGIAEIKHEIITDARNAFGFILKSNGDIVKTDPHQQLFWDVYTGNNGIPVTEEEKRRAAEGLPRLPDKGERQESKKKVLATISDSKPENHEKPDKLKILFTMFGWEEEGGGTMHPRSVAKKLQKKGHDVHVFTAKPKHPKFITPYYLEERTDAGVNIYGLYNRGTQFTDEANPKREVNDPNAVEKFRKVLDKVQPDIIHFHNFLGLSFSIADAAKEFGIPTVFTPHNYHLIDPNLYMFSPDLSIWGNINFFENSPLSEIHRDKLNDYKFRFEKAREILNEKIDHTLAISFKVRDLLIDFGINGNKISVVHQIPESTEYIRPVREELHDPLRFGFIGNVIPQKGVHNIVSAAQHLEPGSVEFYVFGSGAQKYMTTMAQTDTKKTIKWLGKYSQHDLSKISGQIDATIVPSIWQEGAGLVNLESFAMGLPVIGAKIGGIPDFIFDGINGRLYDYYSEKMLAEILNEYIQNPDKLIELQKNVFLPYDFGYYVNHLLNIYKSAISKEEIISKNINLIFEEEYKKKLIKPAGDKNENRNN